MANNHMKNMRFTFNYPTAVLAKTTAQMSIAQGASENDFTFARRLRELAAVIQGMFSSQDATAFAAMETRRQALA